MINMNLFDLNGDIGRGAIGDTPFHDVNTLLEHMDYLGIERSLVTNVESRESNPTIGNRRLLEAIERSQSAQNRLFPVFTINPATWYEYGAMDYLGEKFEERTLRALAAFPATCRHPLSHLEAILGSVDRYKPVLLWTTQENPNSEADYKDLIDLAATYPDITFVCRKIMWGGFSSVLNAMQRCPNVCVDISWVHMRRNVELLVRTFGAERVLFGTGCQTHYGAAIAALNHAEIEDADRRKIAHENLERLMGIERPVKAVEGGRDDKPLWNAIRQGKAIEEPVTDAHGHVGATNRGWILPELDIAEAAQDTIRQMDRLGINRLMVSSEDALFADALEGNLAAERELAPFSDRYSGYLVFNPRFADALIPEFDRFFARGFFVGFKFLPSYWRIPIYDPGYTPVFQYANTHSMPILSHTWDGDYDSPALFGGIPGEYPEASILLGHSGGGTRGRIEAIELANKYPNVYLEFCGSFTTEYSWTKTFDEVGFDRVVFGSDGGGAHDQAWELGRLLSQPVPDDELRPVLAKNMGYVLSRSAYTQEE